jgi:hypothetical protein
MSNGESNGKVAWDRPTVGVPDREVHMLAVSGLGWGLIGVLALIIWVALAFWPARVAGRKGHSFVGFFIFSLFFFPAALVVAYVVRDRRVLA